MRSPSIFDVLNSTTRSRCQNINIHTQTEFLLTCVFPHHTCLPLLPWPGKNFAIRLLQSPMRSSTRQVEMNKRGFQIWIFPYVTHFIFREGNFADVKLKKSAQVKCFMYCTIFKIQTFSSFVKILEIQRMKLSTFHLHTYSL